MGLQNLERKLFGTLNRYVEPAVRKGLFSPRYAPGGLIVLETTGHKSGATRSTPLLATRLGPYLLVSTVRGERSFWVKNLLKDASVRYFLGGKAREASAYVLAAGEYRSESSGFPASVNKLMDLLAPLIGRGWAFAVLDPA